MTLWLELHVCKGLTLLWRLTPVCGGRFEPAEISSRFSSNSEVNTLELLENTEEMFKVNGSWSNYEVCFQNLPSLKG